MVIFSLFFFIATVLKRQTSKLKKKKVDLYSSWPLHCKLPYRSPHLLPLPASSSALCRLLLSLSLSLSLFPSSPSSATSASVALCRRPFLCVAEIAKAEEKAFAKTEEVAFSATAASPFSFLSCLSLSVRCLSSRCAGRSASAVDVALTFVKPSGARESSPPPISWCRRLIEEEEEERLLGFSGLTWLLTFRDSFEVEEGMVERFFFLTQLGFKHDGSSLITLLSGPPSSGKTSLLFQFALNAAALTHTANTNTDYSNHPKVVFICNRNRLQSKPPFLSHGIDPSSDIFQHIQMKYVDDDEEIKKYFAAFHLYDKFPTAVIIDDFGDLFEDRSCQERYGNPRGRDLAMVRILALCHNAIMHANEKGHCLLLMSDTHRGEIPRLLFIYKRWVSSFFTIKGDGEGSFLLRNSKLGNENTGKTRTAKYSIALQRLILEGIAEDEDNMQ